MGNKLIDFESDETLHYILTSVIKRKETVNKLKAKEKKWKLLFLASVTAVISYFFFIFQSGFFTTFSEFFSFLLGNIGHLMFLLLTVSLYFYTVQLQKKRRKQKRLFKICAVRLLKEAKSYGRRLKHGSTEKKRSAGCSPPMELIYIMKTNRIA
nr:DUF2663 family protein [Priestia aryabhattai]MDH3131372.1 DUF2663 family protein [Priestia aryabhattai]